VLLGMPSPASRNNHQDYLLVRQGFVISYNAKRNAMNWASWTVDKSDLGAVQRKNPFRPDPILPQSFYKPNSGDYRLPGYSRGHMVRSGERTASQNDNDETFVFSNMLPQAINNNNGPWNTFENYYRDQVSQRGMVAHVIAGGIFGQAPTQQRGVAVPSATWKVVALLRPGQTPDQIDDRTRIISIIVPNDNNTVKVEHNWDRYRTSVAEIERQTGLSLLAALPAQIAARLKARVDNESIAAPAPREFTPINYGENTSKKITRIVRTGVRGKVDWFSPDKRYGFIKLPDGSQVFVHANDRLTPIADGDSVRMDIALGTDGRTFAVRVRSDAAAANAPNAAASSPAVSASP